MFIFILRRISITKLKEKIFMTISEKNIRARFNSFNKCLLKIRQFPGKITFLLCITVWSFETSLILKKMQQVFENN